MRIMVIQVAMKEIEIQISNVKNIDSVVSNSFIEDIVKVLLVF